MDIHDTPDHDMKAELERLRAEKADALAKLADCEAEMEMLSDELRDSRRLLEESRDSYADLYDFAPVGYVTLTHNGMIQEANATFAAMTGDYLRTLPMPFNLFLATAEDLHLFLAHLDLCRKRGGRINTDLKLKQRSGEVLDVQLSSIPCADFASRTTVYRTAVMDITERKRAEAARDETRRQIQLIMDSAPVPIGYLNKNQQFIFVNAEYLRKFGLEQQEVLDHSFLEVHGAEVEDVIVDRIEKGIAGEASEFEVDVTCQRTEKPYFLRVNIAPDCPPGETNCNIVLVATDLTEQKRILEEVREAKETAERATLAKSQFLANMSHELRTPMNGVLGMLQLLIDGYAGPLQEKQRELAAKAAKASTSLLSIISDILDLSKIDSGKLDLKEKPFSVRECVSGAVELFSNEVQQRGLYLDLTIAEGVPEGMRGDDVRLRQVLINLIGNAVKFTEQGGISVRVEAGARCGAGKREVMISVTDTGIGIPAAKKELLFRPFSQLDDSDTRRHGGTGLGLSISGKILEMMGGTISVDSEEGMGSTFSFTVPLEEAELTKEVPAEAAVPASVVAPISESGEKPRVLVAEDDLLSGDLVKAIFEGQGFQLEMARTGREAVEMWEEGEFDLIIMDVQMPKLDGIAATRIIREKEQGTGKHVPIVAMTAHAYKEEWEKCREAGMDDFLPKPLDIRKGIEVIKSLSKKKVSNRTP